MNDLQIFNNPDFGNIRAVEIDGEPWLIGKDVAKALGYQNPRKALADHVDREDKNTVTIRDGIRGNPNMTIINESGVYSLIFGSKLPEAKQFKHWVTSEVLPSIRKTGGYNPEAMGQLVSATQTLTNAITTMAETVGAIAQEVGNTKQEMENLSQRVDALERQRSIGTTEKLIPAGDSQTVTIPGRAAKRRWMRTLNEKLDLLEVRFNVTRNELLHHMYLWIEEKYNVVLDEERLNLMERLNMDDCTALSAVYYNEKFRDFVQRTIDLNLSPENRGW